MKFVAVDFSGQIKHLAVSFFKFHAHIQTFSLSTTAIPAVFTNIAATFIIECLSANRAFIAGSFFEGDTIFPQSFFYRSGYSIWAGKNIDFFICIAPCYC